jgi:hypothetical protein
MESSNNISLEFWAGNPQVDLVSGEITYLPLTDNLEVEELQQMDSKYLCCANVPIHISISEFSDFISPDGSSFTKNIVHLRVLKGPDQGSYIIVIKMASK